ncbi:putative amino acid transporter [Teratosphaeria nubilosa]|uniref:Putative amino acid transporter n=1 Tax=Teratosphaeria nubilosa TaxID=161662 RepID=A0A6G1LEV7_9PEZI|nr:putative amino acid transporter [Teratosphaeria nubilosa]
MADTREIMEKADKKQELRRKFRKLSTISFTSCVMGTWEVSLTANAPGFMGGGAAGLFWTLVICYVGQFFIILSLAEMVMLVQYILRVSDLAPERSKRYLSYCSGVLACVGWQSIIAADAFIISGSIQNLIQILHPNYEPQKWQLTLLTIAVAVAFSAISILASSHLSLMEGLFAVCHIYAFVPIVLSIWILADHRPPSKVFFHFSGGGGWPSTTLSAVTGQITSIFICLGTDSIMHLSEEIDEPGKLVPQAMVWSYVLNAPMMFLMVAANAMNVSGLDQKVIAYSEFNYIWSIKNAIQDRGAQAGFAIVVVLLLSMSSITVIAATSRLTLSFARDNGLPFSNWIRRKNKYTKSPVNAILVTALFTSGLSLIRIFSITSLRIALSMAAASLMAAYLLAIGCLIRKRLRKEEIPKSQWTLGKYGLACNLIAFAYALWSFLWSFAPPFYQVAGDSFNWTSVILPVLMILVTLLFFIGKVKYRVPVGRVSSWQT